jgi:transposase-like protein
MSKKSRRKFSEQEKTKAVEEYTSGLKTAVEVATELDVAVGLIYRWKSDFESKVRTGKIDELTERGLSRAAGLKIQQQADEIEAYQKKVAEQSLIIDLLKKLQTSDPSVRESELNGLIATMKRSDRKRKPVK